VGGEEEEKKRVKGSKRVKKNIYKHEEKEVV